MIGGNVLVPTIDKSGKLSSMQNFKIVAGEIIGTDGKAIAKLENLVDEKTGE